MNKKFLWAIVLLTLVAAGAVTFFLWPKVELSEIKIATIFPFPDLFIATEKGFFKKEGLKVKFETMSPEDSVSALLAGKVDYAYFLSPFIKPSIEASLRGAPIKIIMFTERHQTTQVITQPELELNDLKTIGVLSSVPIYSTMYYQALKFIEENDLEVEIITAETANELKTFLTLGMADAVLMCTNPFTIWSRAQGFPVLDTLVEVLPSGLSARDDKIEKEPEEVQKVVRALEQAMEFMVTRPEETKELLLKFSGLEKTEENLAMTEELYPLLKTAYDRRNVPVDEGAELLVQIVKAGTFETLQKVEEQIVTPEDLKKVFDFRFVK